MNTFVVREDYINIKIKNSLGEYLGKIHDVMLEKTSNQVAYVVLSCRNLFRRRANQIAERAKKDNAETAKYFTKKAKLTKQHVTLLRKILKSEN